MWVFMSSKALWLFVVILIGSGAAADIPCGYNDTGFHEITPPDTSGGPSGGITFGASSQDQGAPLAGVPRISEPAKEVKSNVDLIEAAVDPENTLTRNKAVEIAADAPGQYNIDQICYIYKYLRDNWEYVSDPRGIDYISSGNNTIKLAEKIAARQNRSVAGAGDCDDYAVLTASLIEAIGGATRIVLAYGGGQGHAYTEVYLGDIDSNSTKAILNWLRNKYGCNLIYGHLTEENKTFWLNLDWNSTHPGGSLFKSPKQSIACVRQHYVRTPVGLPLQYTQLVKTGMLACTVKDEEGNPLATTVLVSGGGKQVPISVDLLGVIKEKLPVGDYEVTASKPGYKFETKTVTLLEDLEASVDFVGARESAPNIQIITEATDPAKRCVYYTRNDEGHQVFKIRVYITGPDFYKIKSVKYSLHQTFENPEHLSTDASNNFEMILWSWGRFVMPITVTTMDGNEYEYMYPFTFRAQLEDAQRSGYRFIDATNAWDVIGGY
ncbi:Transglutaminase-like superfamily protein [uncultured archaeon]|nr:Transglutaminase-like superfamily protein [uncultured archaeon]